MEHRSQLRPETACAVCGCRSGLVSGVLGVCGTCIANRREEALQKAEVVHQETRRAFRLPLCPPRSSAGVRCPLCAQECLIGEGERGYCGLRMAHRGRLVNFGGTASRGVLEWYRDPLPTNCVADWVCAGSRKVGFHNLAVFYASCTLNCLFCQNWHFRGVSLPNAEGMRAEELADAANARTYCVCYFGGDPASQMLHALASARRLARNGVVVCWETAGTSNTKLLDRAVQLSLETGGCIKFDLKAYDDALHKVLTGASNRRTLENFARAARRFGERPEPPLVVASTLLIPGYVNPEEVGRIARYVAGIDPSIPYALLGFAPQFYMKDLPRTSLRHAEAALAAAHVAGLKRVRIGNRHLLSADY